MSSILTSPISLPKDFTPQRFVSWALLLFFIAALLGTSMRVFRVIELPFFQYTHVLHAHSHLAMLGWGFTMIMAVFMFFLKEVITKKQIYRRLLLANVLTCMAMTIAFVLKSYHVISISLLTIHLIIAFALGVLVLKDLKKVTNRTAALLGKWAIYWMFISSIGVWFLPIIIAKVGKLDPLYFASIELFLHLQFNGWFMYSILAFLVFYMEKEGVEFHLKKWQFLGLQVSLILTYALPLYWSYPLPKFYYLNVIGVVIQLLVLWSILTRMKEKLQIIKAPLRGIGVTMILIGLYSYLVKVVLQATLIHPELLNASTEIHAFFIGFIHLVMLGAFSLSIMGICVQTGVLAKNKLSFLGFYAVIIGFIGTEVLLFGQGAMRLFSFDLSLSWDVGLLGLTVFLPLGILAILLSVFTEKSIKKDLQPHDI